MNTIKQLRMLFCMACLCVVTMGSNCFHMSHEEIPDEQKRINPNDRISKIEKTIFMAKQFADGAKPIGQLGEAYGKLSIKEKRELGFKKEGDFTFLNYLSLGMPSPESASLMNDFLSAQHPMQKNKLLNNKALGKAPIDTLEENINDIFDPATFNGIVSSLDPAQAGKVLAKLSVPNFVNWLTGPKAHKADISKFKAALGDSYIDFIQKKIDDKSAYDLLLDKLNDCTIVNQLLGLEKTTKDLEMPQIKAETAL